MYSESTEYVTTYDRLVEILRSKLFNYVEKIIRLENHSKYSLNELMDVILQYKGFLKDISPYKPKNMIVLDGASACLNLEIGYIGVYAVLAILFPKLKRIYGGNFCGIIPEDPNDLKNFSDIILFNRLLDLRRERKIFELACDIIKKYDTEVILLDGSLIPIPRTGLENDPLLETEYVEYVNALRRLHKLCAKYSILLLGFVKRIRSKLLKGKHYNLKITFPENLNIVIDKLVEAYDSIIVDMILSQGEYFPKYPLIIEHVKYNDIKLISVFLKTKEDMTPYRLDIAGKAINDNEIFLQEFIKALGIIKEYMTNTGIPYPILKVDEEVKLSKRLIKELYDDLRYKYLLLTKGRMVSIKALWGEYL